MRRGGSSPLVVVLLAMVFGMALPGWADEPSSDGPPVAAASGKTDAIYMEVAVSSWRPRRWGGVSVETSTESKLRGAGFTPVRSPIEPHDFVLRVDYRESRGQEIRFFGDYQTEIACTAKLEHPEHGLLGHWTIQATPENPFTTRVSYLDSWHAFETNPYFFFLGELVRGAADRRQDAVEVMVQRLPKLVLDAFRPPQPERTPDNWNPHGLASDDSPKLRAVVSNAIRELGRLKDARAVPVLVSLLQHPNRDLRLQTVHALGDVVAPESKSALEATARQDSDQAVRQAAALALAQFEAAAQVP